VVVTPEWKKQLVTPRIIWKNNIKMDCQEVWMVNELDWSGSR
jgi:hypothetical protein